MPVVPQTRDLGVTVCANLSPTVHVCDVVAKAHKRANLILRTFESKDISLLVRAYLVYVRPIVEYNSIVWSPYSVKDIQAIERVQRRFTKRLPALRQCSYQERLCRLQLHSLELRRLLIDLVWCYKILFGHVHLESEEFFQLNMRPSARGHKYKLCKKFCASSVRAAFFSERIVNVWNSLPRSVDFSTLSSFRRSIQTVDFAEFLRCSS